MTIQNKTLNGMCLSHQNVFHLLNKIPDITALLAKNIKTTTHILGLSETRLPRDTDEDLLYIQNYSKPYLRPKEHKLHHGLAVYVHDSIRHTIKRRFDLEHKNVESLWLEIKQNHTASRLIGYIYRNPAYNNTVTSITDWSDDFTDMMDKALNISKDIMLQGDFNIHLERENIIWTSTMDELGMEQLITKPTRIEKDSASIIDHIYKRVDNEVSNVEVLDTSISDHKGISCIWIFKSPQAPLKSHTTVEFRSFKRFQELAFLHDLSCVDFTDIYNCENPDDAFQTFYNRFLSVVDRHAPMRRKRVKHQTLPSWLNHNIILEMDLRDYYKKNKMTELFKRQRNRVTQLVRNSKREYFNSLLKQKNDTKQIWNAINEMTNKKKAKTNKKKSPLSPDSLNEHFLAYTSDLINSTYNQSTEAYIPSELLEQFCQSRLVKGNTFQIPAIAVHEVGKLLSDLKNKKSMGPDNISTYLLKLALPYIVEPLTHAYNLCIEQNIFPSQLKDAKVIPLPKTKDLNDPANYRPISILSVLSKPLERHVHKYLLRHLENNNLIVSSQSGFRPKHSCQTALTKMCESWLTAINNESVVGAVFLDFHKAFDTVDHTILMKKLALYLGDNASTSFLGSYMSNRKQFVSVNGESSKYGKIISGVPQGSILGPLLFSIFINDLPLAVTDSNRKAIKNGLSESPPKEISEIDNDLFADDDSLYTSHKNPSIVEKSLQLSLDVTSDWCHNNRMVLHPKKSRCMVIATRQKHQIKRITLELDINKQLIEQVDQHRVLGVILDNEYKWLPHLVNVMKTVSKNLYLLSQLRHYANADSLMIFYYAHILTHFCYASNLWDNCADTHFKKLNSSHRRAIKLIHPDKHVDTDIKFKQLELLPLDRQLTYNKAIIVYKTLNNLSPAYMTKFCKKACCRYGSNNLLIPKTRIDLCKTSLSFSGAVLWNALPRYIQTSSSLPSFKRALKHHLLNLP